MKPIVVVGSINMDLVVNVKRAPLVGETVAGLDFKTYSGGKGANQAVAAARLGAQVHMIGKVGTDAFGDELIASLEGAGVDCTAVERAETASGVAVIVVSESGDNSIIVTPGANALLSPDDLDRHIAHIETAGYVLAQLEVPLPTVQYLAELCAKAGVPLILDPAPARELPAELLRLVGWFTPNETEAKFYLPQAEGLPAKAAQSDSDQLLSLGVRGVVLKRGDKGSYIAESLGSCKSVAPIKVKAVDTTAAGDAFNGAFAVALSMGKSPVESAEFASAAAAIAVTRHGAQPSMPTMQEVEALLCLQK